MNFDDYLFLYAQSVEPFLAYFFHEIFVRSLANMIYYLAMTAPCI